MKRVEALRKKIAALESLATNPSTTLAESESAQRAGNRLRLELARRLRDESRATSQDGTPPSDAASGDPDARPGQSSGPRPSTDTSQRSRRRRSSAAPGGARLRSKLTPWAWLFALVASVSAVSLATRVPLRAFEGEPAARDGLAQPTTAAGAQAETPADLARIAHTQGAQAAAAAVRACEARRLMLEFRATAGATPREGEGNIDVRRRCETYLTVRGLDDAICSPATRENPHPTCPLAE